MPIQERKVRMTMPYGMPMVITRDTKKYSPEPLFIFTLTNFEFKNGNVRWTIESDKGVIYEGGTTQKSLVDIQGYGKIKIVLAIPMTLHKQSNILSPEFMIMVPEQLRVFNLSSLKKRYGTSHSFFK